MQSGSLVVATAAPLERNLRFRAVGGVEAAVGGYSFEEAATENPDTHNFYSTDGHLTFAIVAQTDGNGFFDPLYVGAKAAVDMIGAENLLLGSEASTEDVARQIGDSPWRTRPGHKSAGLQPPLRLFHVPRLEPRISIPDIGQC